MTVESDLFAAIKSLTTNRCFPDVAPNGATAPYTVFQQVGGSAFNFLESAVVGKRNARFQVSSWATTRIAAKALALSVEDALVASTLRAYVLGAPTSVYESETLMYGCHQDFTIFY